jgi:hypothetical protein
MTMPLDSVSDVEALLRDSGVVLEPAPEPQEDVAELQTADGRFTVAPARVMGRETHVITLYRMDTAEPVTVDVNEAPRFLKKRFPNTDSVRRDYPHLVGKYAFTLGRPNSATGRYDPPFERQLGALVCMLNPESPDFAYTRSLGITATCRRRYIPNIIELERHMARHEGAWSLIQRDRADRTRREDQERLTQLIELVLSQRGLDTSRAPAVAEQVAERLEQETEVQEPVENGEPRPQPVKRATVRKRATAKRKRRVARP